MFLDAGGVLSRLRAPRPVVLCAAAREMGHDLSRSQAEAYFAEWRRMLAEDEALWEDYPGFRERLLAAGARATGLGDAFPAVRSRYRHLLQDPRYRTLYDDARSTLRRLAEADVRLGVISNAVEALVPFLRQMGVASFFDAIVASEPTGYEKPQREIFAHALDALGVAAGEAVHVGDSYYYDYLGATRAGLRGLLLDRTDRWPVDAPKIRTLGDLPGALDLQGI